MEESKKVSTGMTIEVIEKRKQLLAMIKGLSA
jgi:hypothetical protein